MLSKGQLTLATQLSRIIELLTLGREEAEQARQVERAEELLGQLKALELDKLPEPTSERAVVGELTIDFAGHEVWFGGRRLHLTHREFELLAYLVRNRGRVCKREAIVAHVWGDRSLVSSRTVDIHIYRLRSKLLPSADFIETIRNVGYILRVPSTLDAPAFSE